MTSRSSWIVGIVLIGLGWMPATSMASVVLSLSVTGNTGTNAPNSNTTSGVITYDGFTINALAYISNETNGSLSFIALEVMNNGTGGTLTITLTDNAMVVESGYAFNLTSTTTVIGNQGPVTFQSFLGTDSTQLATPLLTFAPSTSNNLSSTAGGYTPTGPTYTLSSVSTITLGQGQSVEAFTGYSVVSTPEPATLVMTLSGLPVVGFFAWRHRRRERLAVRA